MIIPRARRKSRELTGSGGENAKSKAKRGCDTKRAVPANGEET